jgi:hypothetical protein
VPTGQGRSTTRPHARSHTGMRIHPHDLGSGRLRHARPDSTTYLGAIETAEAFGKRIYLEAWKRGCSRAENRA